MEVKNRINGNLYWIFEALKVVNKEINFDLPTLLKSNKKEEIMFYECLVFNKLKEDSLFLHINGILYEYFSDKKNELILKLIKLFINRNHSSIQRHRCTDSVRIHKTDLPQIKNQYLTAGTYTRSKINVIGLDTVPNANLLLVYYDNTTTWIYNYEIKKLLLNFKFLPNSNNIKIMRIFPVTVKALDIKNPMFIDKEDKFSNTKEEIISRKSITSKNREDFLNEKFVEKIKYVFFDKYSLLLKKLDIQTFELDGYIFLYDVKDIIFEKYDVNDIKLVSEMKLNTFRQHHQYKPMKINKESQQLREKFQFLNTMMEAYENAKKEINLNKYLNIPEKDKTTDRIFKLLRPKCNYTFSELIHDNLSTKVFSKNATNNLWNEF